MGRKAKGITRNYQCVASGQIHYRQMRQPSAHGRALLLLHQVSSSSRMFERIMPMLADAGLTPVAPDLPGFGASDPLDVVSMSGWVEMLIEFLDGGNRWPPLWIVGHHTGAGVAVELALARPEAVSGLILVGIPFFSDENARRSRWRAKKVRRIVPEPGGGHLLHEWGRLKELAPSIDPWLLHREAVDTFASNRYDLAYEEIFAWDGGARLPAIECPVMVIRAIDDTLYAGQAEAAQRIRGSRMVTVEGGVFVFDERPEMLAHSMVPFIREAR